MTERKCRSQIALKRFEIQARCALHARHPRTNFYKIGEWVQLLEGELLHLLGHEASASANGAETPQVRNRVGGYQGATL